MICKLFFYISLSCFNRFFQPHVIQAVYLYHFFNVFFLVFFSSVMSHQEYEPGKLEIVSGGEFYLKLSKFRCVMGFPLLHCIKLPPDFLHRSKGVVDERAGFRYT